MTIRRARLGDAPACASILGDWIDETPWMPMLHSRASMTTFWAKRLEEASGWVSLDGALVNGFCLRDEGMITALYLAPSARRKGIGPRLLGQAKADLPRLDLWVFAANKEAHRFYLREGFYEVQRSSGDNEENLEDIQMRWTKE